MPAARAHRSARASGILLVCAAMAAAAFAAPASPKIHTVTIEGMHFIPGTLTVHRGDRVVWVNSDLFPHTATAKAAGFDSGGIAPNASWRHVADKPGTFRYICTFHPAMTGTLIVE